MKKHILYALLLVFVTSFSATAQKNRINGIKFSRHHFVDTVKIKIWDGAVIIPVEINGVLITEYCIYLNLVTEAKEQHCVFRTPEGTIKEVDW